MYQSPEIIRQLVDDRHAQRRRTAVLRRIEGSVRRERRRGLRMARVTLLFRRHPVRPVAEPGGAVAGPATA